MSEKITTGSERSRPSALTLLLIAVSTLLLASCGGGSDSASSVEVADGTGQALGVSRATSTVPGGWTGRAPKMEVINGITVPPEPAPAINNATLVGVDVNANGVRDDVERKIARLSASPTVFNNSIHYAKVYAGLLSEPAPITRDEALVLLLKPNCAAPTDLDQLADMNLLATLLNTPQRIAKYKAITNLVAYIDPSELEAKSCQ